MTIAMLALAGIPATAGFTGKFYLIDAAVSGGYTWLGVVIVIGSMISLGYYLPVVGAMWMGSTRAERRRCGRTGGPDEAGPLPALAGGSPELDAEPRPSPAAASPRWSSWRSRGCCDVFFGIVPQPLFDLVHQAGGALGLL